MKMFNRIVFYQGIDIYIKEKWYGIHFYWQEDPLFDIIHAHKKCNTVHEYGIIVFGLWVYIRID